MNISKHEKVIIPLSMLFFATAAFMYLPKISKDRALNSSEKETVSQVTPSVAQVIQEQSEENKPLTLVSPLDKAVERINKKPFGIFINSQNSPVQPERFYGYHTGADFEIFPGEENIEVQVKSICSGELISKRSASGYGGIAVQSCDLDGESVTVVYGHLKLSSISKNINERFEVGENLGILGNAYSNETDGERKHLHLGIHKGKEINILGYVQTKEFLENWIDPCQKICK